MKSHSALCSFHILDKTHQHVIRDFVIKSSTGINALAALSLMSEDKKKEEISVEIFLTSTTDYMLLKRHICHALERYSK